MTPASLLSEDEIQHLSGMLLSENNQDLEIGFQILSAHPNAIASVRRELLLIAHLSYGCPHAEAAHDLLQQQFSAEQMQAWRAQFEVFYRYRDLYDPEEFDEHWHLFEQHEAVRAEYMPLLMKKTTYVREYFSLAETISEFHKQRLDWAERYYALVLAHNPDDVPTLHRLGNLQRDHYYNYQRALSYYERVLQINPSHYYTLEAVSLLHLDYLKNPEQALYWIHRGLEEYPQDEHLQVWLADVYMSQKNEALFDQGEALLNTILERNPYNTAAWTIYGNHLWITLQSVERAEKVYTQGLKHNPNSYNLLGNLAELYERVYGDAEKAKSLYLKSFSIYKDDPYHLGNFVRLLVVQLRDFKRGKSYYDHLRTLFFGPIRRQVEWTDQQWKGVRQAEKLLWSHFPELKHV